MKIEINKDESYNINLPSELNANDFLRLLEQFEKIGRLIKMNEIKTNIGFPSGKPNIIKPKIYSRIYRNPFFDTREKVLDILQYHFHGTIEDKKRISKIIKDNWDSISKKFHHQIERYSIKPKEVGLTRFRKKGEYSLEKIPNYIIKSYTGIFDENGNN